jgi:hypothetical protein
VSATPVALACSTSWSAAALNSASGGNISSAGRVTASTPVVVFDVDVIAMILSGPRLLTADHQDHPQLHTPRPAGRGSALSFDHDRPGPEGSRSALSRSRIDG